MARNRITVEQIVHKLGKVKVAIAKGKSVPEAGRKIRATEQTYYRRRKEYVVYRLSLSQDLSTFRWHPVPTSRTLNIYQLGGAGSQPRVKISPRDREIRRASHMNAAAANTHTRRALYLTCMKNRTTIAAFTTAIVMAAITLASPRSHSETATVKPVSSNNTANTR